MLPAPQRSPFRAFAARIGRALLALDSYLDSSFFDSSERMRDRWARFSTFMDRFHVAGARRGAIELACEGLTLGSAGALLMLALALPAFRETSDDWLKRQELAVTFLDRYGAEVGRRGIKHDDSVKLAEYPDHFLKAVLATEDRRFYEHFGIDLFGTARALSANARASGVVQGGSSLTQQLAKNLFLTNERSIERKIKEAFLALWLESRLSKDEILKLYLDRAYMGGGSFGAAAAADYYYDKSAKELSLAESAMLAGLFKAPTKYAPHVNLPAARARANDVLSNMVEAGFLTEGQVLAARRNPATPADRKREAHPDYYLDWAFEEIKRLAGNDKFGADRVLTVRTSLDAGLQKHTDAALENALRQHGEEYDTNQGALVVMDPDGAVRAIVGGRDYGVSQFNRATDALRQPGSSFKTFVYATALSAGIIKPNSVVVDAPVCIGDWCPKNYNESHSGSMPVTTAFAKSINTIPVRLSLMLGRGSPNPAKAGRARIIETTRRMGVQSDIKDTPSLPIGAVDVTAMDMATGYATIANGGRRATPHAALEIRNGRDEVIWRRDRDVPPGEQVLSTGVVADMTLLLSKVVEEGTGKRAALDMTRAVGKTGTTNAYRDAWFVGFTGNYVASVWFGNDDNSETNDMTGGTLPAMTWRDVMAYAHQGLEIRPLPGLAPMGPAPVVAARQTGPVRSSERTPAVSGVVQRPQTLSKRSFEVLEGIEQMFVSSAAQGATATLAPAEGNQGFAANVRTGSARIVVP